MSPENRPPVPKCPQAGPFAETAAMGRKAVAEGRMTAGEAQRLSDQAYRDAMVIQLLDLPVETDSIELSGQSFPPGEE